MDLDNLRANTTWTDIYAEPTGFDYIIVNGKVSDPTVKADKPTFGRVLLKTKGD